MASSNFSSPQFLPPNSSFGGGGDTESKVPRALGAEETELELDSNAKLIERIRLVNMVRAVCKGDVKVLEVYIRTSPSNSSTISGSGINSEMRKLHDLIATSTGADKEGKSHSCSSALDQELIESLTLGLNTELIQSLFASLIIWNKSHRNDNALEFLNLLYEEQAVNAVIEALGSAQSELGGDRSYLATSDQYLTKETALQNIRDSVLLLTDEEVFVDAAESIFSSITSDRKMVNLFKLLNTINDEYFNRYVDRINAEFQNDGRSY